MGLNIKLIVAYDGVRYLGWQKTIAGPSVEEALKTALERLLQQNVKLQAASRTDAGVHAHHQVVNFYTTKETIDLGKLLLGINALLPNDISIMDIEMAPESFHATVDCCKKEYRYMICNAHMQYPQNRHFSWHYPLKLNIDAMRRAAEFLIGTHDFTSFANIKKNEPYESHIRTIESINIVELSGGRIEIQITGNSFLYKMVRNIVGTLVYVGAGKLSAEAMPEILTNKDRTVAGVTAPAHGLTLFKVFY